MENRFMNDKEAFGVVKKISVIMDSEKDIVSSVEELTPNICKRLDKVLDAWLMICQRDIDLFNLKACFKFYHNNYEAGLEDYNKTKDKNAEKITLEEYTMLYEVMR